MLRNVEVKTGGKADNSGTPRSDTILEKHTESLKHLEPMHVHWMKSDTQREVL